MTSKTVDAFFGAADRDPALRTKLEQLPTEDRDAALTQVVQIAGAAGYPLQREELEGAIASHAESGELSLPDLDKVVGGAGPSSPSSFSRLATTLKPKLGAVGVVAPCFKPKGAVGPCFRPKGVIAPCD